MPPAAPAPVINAFAMLPPVSPFPNGPLAAPQCKGLESWGRKRHMNGMKTHDPSDRLSQILPRLAEGTEDRLTIATLLERMQDRAHTALLVLFALPNALPAIPGTSAILGIPLVYLSLQLAMGRPPYLPEFIAKRAVNRASFAGLLARAQPMLQRGERYLHPRLSWLTSGRMERVVGVLMAIMALSVLLPIPFGNMLPAFAIILFALGLMEEDGAWVLAGLGAMAVGILLFSTVLWGLFKAALFVFLGALGL